MYTEDKLLFPPWTGLFVPAVLVNGSLVKNTSPGKPNAFSALLPVEVEEVKNVLALIYMFPSDPDNPNLDADVTVHKEALTGSSNSSVKLVLIYFELL